MDDFLHQLRNNSREKRYERNHRKPYDGSHYRGNERRDGPIQKKRKYNKREQNEYSKSYSSRQFPEIRSLLEEISKSQTRLANAQERIIAAEERKATAIENIAETLQKLCMKTLNRDSGSPVDSLEGKKKKESNEINTSKEKTGANKSREETIEVITQMRSDGISYEKIARHLEEVGIPTISGRGIWRGQSVRRLCID
jgi:hypothetical protein